MSDLVQLDGKWPVADNFSFPCSFFELESKALRLRECVLTPRSSIEFLSPPSRPGGFGPLAPLRPTRLRARSAGWGLGGRVSAGAGLVGLWGDVLSTHCEEAGDVISRRAPSGWQTRRACPPRSALCQAGVSPDDVINVDCEWELGPVFSQTLLPLGRRGRHCVWVRFLAAVGQMETLTIKTLSAPLVVPQRNRPRADSSRDT